LTHLEVGLSEALNLLGTHRHGSRLRRRRHHAGHSSRGTRRCRLIGSVAEH
jgi:hypothetical protein